MWVIVANKEINYFKRKCIRYYLYILINKIKGYEVEVLKDEGI